MGSHTMLILACRSRRAKPPSQHTLTRLLASRIAPALSIRRLNVHKHSADAPSSHLSKLQQKLQRRKKPIAKSPLIRKFSPDITRPSKAASKPVTTASKDIAPSLHPVQKKVAHQQRSVPSNASKPQPKPAHEIKQRVVQKALDEAKPQKVKRTSFFKKHPKFLSISTLAIMVLLVGGYLTYANLPGLSVRVAAIQAGISASIPSYQPSGYSLVSPVQYKEGEVTMKFHANAGPQSFAVTQQRSSWDSSALLENYVNEKSDNNYNTYNDSGLTIYVFGTNAAWVNGGILHVVEGDAPLTNEQIRRIATSM